MEILQIKNSFASGATPHAADFDAIIDLAERGRKATGQSPDCPKLGLGIVYDASAKPPQLKVDPSLKGRLFSLKNVAAIETHKRAAMFQLLRDGGNAPPASNPDANAEGQTISLPPPLGSSTASLRISFSEGSLPTAEDYEALIVVATAATHLIADAPGWEDIEVSNGKLALKSKLTGQTLTQMNVQTLDVLEAACIFLLLQSAHTSMA